MRDAFLLIYGHAEQLFDGAFDHPFRQSKARLQALRFFFCATAHELNLHDAANAIDPEIRVDVLRLRVMYEFWLRDWSLPALPHDAEALPSRIELAAASRANLLGITLAKLAWFQPGILVADVLSELVSKDVSEVHVLRALKALSEDYLVSVSSMSRVYVTGANPRQEQLDRLTDPEFKLRGKLANLYWSRRF